MPSDDETETTVPADPEDIDDTPTISCRRCGRSWDLDYELEDLGVGNQAVEQFALDHHRHTGHFPDGVSTWRATCRQCPETTEHLASTAARRWARTHARHTRHTVELQYEDEVDDRIEPPVED